MPALFVLFMTSNIMRFFFSSRHKRIRVHVNANKSEKERGLKGFCVRQAIKKEFLCATFHHYAICICAE